VSTSLGRSARLPLLGVGLSVWAALPPYSGPSLAAAARAEVVDHVVPAVVLLIVSLVALLVARRASGPGTLPLACALVAALCGLWMTATHLPLVVQATRGEAPWPAVAYHAVPGLAVLALGALWTARSWSAAEPVRPG
jgi:hypothetical protein